MQSGALAVLLCGHATWAGTWAGTVQRNKAMSRQAFHVVCFVSWLCPF